MTSEHFSDEELRCRHCGKNECKPELLDALEALRAIVAVPINVDCAFRCEVHNLEVGGVPGSEHVLGLAADIKIQGMTTRQMYRAAIRVPAFANGGIGVAAHQRYIHVDTRGHRARWLYNIAGKATSSWDSSLDQAA